MRDMSRRGRSSGGISQVVAVTKRRFTIREYQKMGESGILGEDDRIELIAGEIVEMSPIGSQHAGHVARVQDAVSRAVARQAIVWVQNPVDLDDYSEPEPDLTLLRPRDDFYASQHPRPADVLLVIEVSDSSARYDREVKLPLYAHAGIPEVWILDLAVADHIDMYRQPTANGYRGALRAERGDTVDLPGLAGAPVEVDALLG